jgi:hypothetical protein
VFDRITVEPGKMNGQPCIRGVKFLIDNNISRGICLCREPGGHEAADRPTCPRVLNRPAANSSRRAARPRWVSSQRLAESDEDRFNDAVEGDLRQPSDTPQHIFIRSAEDE